MIMYPSSPVEFDSLIFEDAPWELYEAFLKSYDEAPSRISYDRGKMEVVMTLSAEHELLRQFMHDVVRTCSQVFRIDVTGGGSATLKLHAQQRGVEADQCYWVANAAKARGLRRLDLSVDPAPDLVLEIDITHSAVDRETIYASLGVVEMWTYSPATNLSGWVNRDGTWDRAEYSTAFPRLQIAELNNFVDRFRAGERELIILDDLRVWLAALP